MANNGWALIDTTTRAVTLIASLPVDGKTQCSFSIKTPAAVKIGNTDATDLINDALRMFSRTYDGVERVRADGRMNNCLG